MSYNEVTRSGKEYVGYEYKTINVDSEKASMYVDAYENFGWILDDSIPLVREPKIISTLPTRQFGSTITLKLKRDRKIMSKAELTRLQQHFESCMDEIEVLEKSKTKNALIYALVIGFIGTAFLAGSVFAVTAEPPKILLCIILGIPGLIGWALPYLVFKIFLKKRTTEVTPLIEQKYDEIHGICEKGNSLIHK